MKTFLTKKRTGFEVSIIEFIITFGIIIIILNIAKILVIKFNPEWFEWFKGIVEKMTPR